VVAYACNSSYLGGLPKQIRKQVQDPTSNNKNLSVVVHTCQPSYLRSTDKKIVVHASQGINSRPYQKITKVKRAEGVAQVVEALSSNPSTASHSKK
jgi:hypothetical protein